MSFKKNTRSDLDDNLINRTENTEDYESELQKRSSLTRTGANGVGPSKKNHTYKVVLLVGLAILAISLLIVVIVTLSSSKSGIEDEQEHNMFKAIGIEKSLRKVVVQLESKYKSKTGRFTNLKAGECIDASIGEGKVCEKENNKFADDVTAEFSVLGTGISRSFFWDTNNPHRWNPAHVDGFLGDIGEDELSMLDGVGFETTDETNFGFKLTDVVSNKPVFDSTKRPLIFTDKYLEIGFTLPTQTLFGLGQHNSKFLLSEGEWTMWNRDQPGSPKAEGEGKQQLYGTHPFLMFKTSDNKFGGILFYNSNAQNILIRFSETGKALITYRTVGGILDIYHILSDTADEVIKKYNDLVGKPALPPFWALGFHQCSWQYNTTEDLKGVLNAYKLKEYPIDTIWTDIMYMDRYIDFTVDETNFTGIKDFINTLHKEDRHFVPIVDAGISLEPPKKGPKWYAEGDKAGAFIKSTQNPGGKYNGNIIGKVWPGYTAFVDFISPAGKALWNKGLTELDKIVPFDGLWLDMNEPSNFCTAEDMGKEKDETPIGECYPQEAPKTDSSLRNLGDSPVGVGEFDDIPFTPGGEKLDYKTLSMDAYFHDENDNGTFVMYNIHNMYGTLETIETSKYLASRDKRRHLIISRDSFVGHGKYGSIWTGDNDATYQDLTLSINQIMNFNMFGMPFVGGDVCGFGGSKANSTLCARWAQVGAFYPFFRNHYAIGKERQEFYQYPDEYQKGMKEAIRLRYSLLRYLYTCLYISSDQGYPTIRHPMYQWPDVGKIVENENSFMIGSAVRITANFDLSDIGKEKKFKAPFAKGRYMEYIHYTITKVKKDVEDIELYNGYDIPNIHIVEGSIVSFQSVDGVTKTQDLIDDQLRLLIFPTENGYARGNVFIANGVTTDEKEQFFDISHSNKAIQFFLRQGVADDATQFNEVIEEIHIVGVEDADKDHFVCFMDTDGNFKPLNIESKKGKDGETDYIRIFGGTNTIEFDQTDTIYYGVVGKDYNYCNRGYTARVDSQTTKEMKVTIIKTTNQMENSNDLKLNVAMVTDGTIQVTITDGEKRFEVPKEALSQTTFQTNDAEDIKDYVEISKQGEKFSLKIHEKGDPENYYFKINEDSLIFSDYYLSMETTVNTNQKLYGFGERVTDFFLKEGIYTTWAKDATDPFDDGKKPGKNIYGTHPVYFTRSSSPNKYHWGMFNLNANAQDTKIEFVGANEAKISHYITGTGIFDMYFFIENKSPEEAVNKYHNIIGNTLLPPFWGLGWHQCKYGYTGTENLKEVYKNYTDNDFPMDVLWSDIDYMEKYRDFTYDSNGTYKGLPEFVKTLKQDNRRYVPIIDAGVAIVDDGSYKTFDEGVKKGVFIKSGNKNRNGKNDPLGKGGVLYGKVWPGYAAFPDFTNENTNKWWVDIIKEFNEKLDFDGLWLDMNEVANFCVGPCIPDDIVPFEESLRSKITYQPGGVDIEEKMLSIDGVHKEGTELDYHSLFGFLQGVATHKYFADRGDRPFIISRSTFSGQGKWTSHWNGDNHATFDYLKASVTGIINMNIYGMNFNGADICGFLEDTNTELCEKWTNVGAFYPFSRNHNDIHTIDQEPYRYEGDVKNNMRNAIRWRYPFLRYFYTQLYLNHKNGGTFWKPLFFEFPDEDLAYTEIEKNVMIGSALKLNPMLDEGTTKTQSFLFPAGVWCNVLDYSCLKVKKTSSQNLNVQPNNLNLHLRMGHIIPLQRSAVEKHVNTTVDLNELPMGIMINMDTNTKKATGDFYADEGTKLNDPDFTHSIMDFEFDGTEATLTFNQQKSGYIAPYTKLGLIEIVGAKNAGLNKLLKVVSGATEVTGNYDSKHDLLTFRFEESLEISTLSKVKFTK
ncbi:unnamed protein product [Moneuplotes crassus]|uniref:Maltase n=1 Tax=Euplotes crassus TaxID=5936 RepID=A0AAD1Y176_EUPCR|nr:unnamed protein product [Moneuplotes crassus]